MFGKRIADLEAVALTMYTLRHTYPEYDEYITSFPEGKDFIIDVAEACLLENHTKSQYRRALKKFLPTAKIELDSRRAKWGI